MRVVQMRLCCGRCGMCRQADSVAVIVLYGAVLTCCWWRSNCSIKACASTVLGLRQHVLGPLRGW
jgi:hypothetical protein